MIPTAANPKASPNWPGESPSSSISTNDEPEIKTSWR